MVKKVNLLPVLPRLVFPMGMRNFIAIKFHTGEASEMLHLYELHPHGVYECDATIATSGETERMSLVFKGLSKSIRPLFHQHGLLALPAEESLALITKPPAPLSALWDAAPLTCHALRKVNLELQHLLQVMETNPQ